MSKPMNLQQFEELVNHAKKKHPPDLAKKKKRERMERKEVGKGVLFMSPLFDMRNQMVPLINITWDGGKEEFYAPTTGGSQKNLFDLVMAWLDEEK